MALSDGAPDVPHHPPPVPHPLPILPTIGSAFQVFGRAPGRFLGLLILPVLFGLVPSLLAAMVAAEPWYPAARAGAIVIRYALEFMAHGAIIAGVAAIVAGRSFEFETVLGTGFRRSIAYLAVTLLSGLAILFGTMLLVVPGVVATLALAVAIPATVLEDLGPVASLRRSAALTQGHRWRILAIGLVVLVPAIGATVAAVALAVGHHAVLAAPLVLALVAWAAILGAILPCVLFLTLRDMRPPAGPIRLPGAPGAGV